MMLKVKFGEFKKCLIFEIFNGLDTNFAGWSFKRAEAKIICVDIYFKSVVLDKVCLAAEIVNFSHGFKIKQQSILSET